MSTLLISTITPCFRMEKYLKHFLERLPQQTIFSYLQVVLDHNEPTVEELEWVRDFQARYPGRLKHMIKDQVVPIGPSMNDCIMAADADLLAVWNVDDLRTPDSLERQYRALQASNAGVAYGDFFVVPVFGEKEGYFVDCAGVAPTEHMRSMIAGPFFMFRKGLCEKAGYFDEQLKSGADFDFCIRLAHHSDFLHVPVNLGFYLNEGLGASTRPGCLQAVERTVVELRYGIYDKLDYTYLPKASVYVIPQILNQGQWVPVATFVPQWEMLLQERGQALLAEGIAKNYLHERCEVGRCGIRRLAQKVIGKDAYSALKKIWQGLKRQ